MSRFKPHIEELINIAVKNGVKSVLNVNFPRNEIKGYKTATFIDSKSLYDIERTWKIENGIHRVSTGGPIENSDF